MNRVTLISAMTKGRVIGDGEGMPWDVPEEYQRFVDTVKGFPVVFGRTSYEINGKTLEDSPIVVVTSRDQIDSVQVSSSIEEALRLAGEHGGGETFVAGGASVYEQALPLADRMLLSTIHGDYEGSVYFPAFDESEWKVSTLEEHERYTFREWLRR